jgi:LysM repeat protein
MASFIIHTIVGETLLNEIERKYNITISDYNRKNFLLGNLIPDSLKTDKTIPSTLKEDEITAYKIEIKNKIIIKISNYETEKITYLGIGIGRPRR